MDAHATGRNKEVTTMRKTALILAGAAVFDLGVMVVGAQARQQSPTPPPTPGVPDQGTARGQHIKHGPEFVFIKLDQALTARACGARRGEVVRHEGVQQCRLPTPGSSDGLKHSLSFNFLKIDLDYTARACTSQRGEVVTHEGVQQCRVPADGAGSANARAGPPPGDPAPRGRIMQELSSMEVQIFIKIDAVDTIQACTARRGEVVTHEGVQQCRLPGPAGSGDPRPSPRGR